MDYKHQRIPVSRIAAQDETYRITTNTSLAPLTTTIREIGLLHLPWLIEERGEFQIVAGFRRIAACRDLGWRELQAKVLAPATTRRVRIQIAVADNSFARELNVVELSRAYGLLADEFGDSAALAEVASQLNLPRSVSWIQKVMRVRDFPPSLQKALLTETVALPTALTIMEFPSSERCVWIDFFDRLQLGLNRQRECMTLVLEIARREKRTSQEVLQDHFLAETMADEKIELPRKTGIILAHLRRRRYPEKCRAEALFAEKTRCIAAPPGGHETEPAQRFRKRSLLAAS